MPKFKLLESIETHMARKHLPIVRESHLYPTEASVELEVNPLTGTPEVLGTCLRAAWYRSSGEFKGEAYSAYTHWVFSTGNAVEDAMTEKCKEMGIWVDNSVRFYNKEYNISGEIDLIVVDPDTNKPVIVEQKTFSGYNATKSILGNKSTKGAPKEAHLLQLLVYLETQKHIFELGKLIYINKSAMGNAEFDVSIIQEGKDRYPVVDGVVQRRFTIQQMLDRYKKLAGYIERKELPPRDFQLKWSDERVEAENELGNISKSKYEKWQKGKASIGDYQCGYCRYSQECWKLPSRLDLVAEED